MSTGKIGGIKKIGMRRVEGLKDTANTGGSLLVKTGRQESTWQPTPSLESTKEFPLTNEEAEDLMILTGEVMDRASMIMTRLMSLEDKRIMHYIEHVPDGYEKLVDDDDKIKF